ncbi:60S ribosomal L7 [Brachionus plicatilis]|uniref:60S ribosomal L7 n=1 Tax=Brachionus plicatilis TaxID=10195 RepID=A0A3M7RZF3_BRAPC|nr:60S ribosomal L7 [Brachionus plicatilis]
MLIKSVRLMPVIRSLVQRRALTAQSQVEIKAPQMDGENKDYSTKIVNLVEEISKLNLIEVSDLNELLRKKLNIKDVPMNFAAMPAGAAAAPQEEAEEALPKATKSSFRLKLIKFDDTKKVALIKEIKALGENINLVQAKKFVESLPQVFRDNIPKDEADKLKEQLEKAGATCEIE